MYSITVGEAHCYSHVLHYNVLMWDQTVHTVMAALPPVLRGSVIQKKRSPLLEGQLPGTTPYVVKLGNSLDLFHL